jgi:SAM-dependent methyltransferase
MTFAGHAMTRYVLGIPQDASGAFRVYRLDRIPSDLFGLIHSKSYGFFFESMFVFNRNKLLINQVPITLPARTYGNSKMSARAAWSSARYIFELALENIRRPERFLRPAAPVPWDASLQDPQNWDAYWNASGQKGNPIYETIAGIYRRGVIKRNLERVIRREFAPGSALLHAGCGSGQVDTGLQSEMKLTGLDISRGALNLYARNNQRAEAVVPGSIFGLPFSAEHFDGVYNLGVMEHFTAEEIGRILGEFNRVLKPGGKVVLFWPHAHAPSVWVLRICHTFLRLFFKNPVQLHPPEISLLVSQEDVRSKVEKAGFRLTAFDFGPRDFWIQAAVVCKKT